MTTSLQPIAPMEAKSLVDSGKAVLIDIREPMEHARERIPGARLVPLSKLGADAIAAAAGAKQVIYHCQSGARTTVNAARLAGAVSGTAYVVAGGIVAWKAARLPTAAAR